MLSDRMNSYQESPKCIDKSIKYPTPVQYKTDFPFLKEVDSLALANAQLNLNKAYGVFLPIPPKRGNKDSDTSFFQGVFSC